LNPAAGPGQFLSVKQATARPDDSISKVPTEALKNLSLFEGMLNKLQPNLPKMLSRSEQQYLPYGLSLDPALRSVGK
jgi:hypothetical protein